MRALWWLAAAACGCSPAASVETEVADAVADVGVSEIASTDVVAGADAVDAAVVAKDPTVAEQLQAIPAGTFSMGDHSGQGSEDPKHPSDELPLHDVTLAAFALGRFEVTNDRFAAFLNDVGNSGGIDIAGSAVYGHTDGALYAGLAGDGLYSRIAWNGTAFSVETARGNHPVVDIRWEGALAYCNWLSVRYGFQPLCDVKSGVCDLTGHGFRLPTEAEWEYAARGGQTAPYRIFPWGDDVNADGTLANWQDSLDPFEAGALPWTTPVGFYDGSTHAKADFAWPGDQQTYATRNAVNGYGLHDVSGNVWELVYDWYAADYYKNSAAHDPPGPMAGQPMPDGKPYRAMRGGNWYNGKEYFGHGRVANRNPTYFRGPLDPNHPWYHVGFRVLLK